MTTKLARPTRPTTVRSFRSFRANAPPSTLQARWFSFVAACLYKKLGKRDFERARKSVQQIQWGSLPLCLSFDAAEVGAVNTAVKGKSLLRDAFLHP